MKAHYTQFILTVIATMLAWNLMFQRSPVAHAQVDGKYRVSLVHVVDPAPGNDEQRKTATDYLARELNKSAKGAELVMLIPIPNSAAVYAVFKD